MVAGHPIKETTEMLRTLLPILVLAGLVPLTGAQSTNETRCRTVESIYFARGNGDGTVSGLPGDLIIFRNRSGGIIAAQTVDWYRRNLPYYVYWVEANSGGQYSVRFAYWFLKYYNPGLASVEVWRGYDLVDKDPIY